jgi:hypothetical protein
MGFKDVKSNSEYRMSDDKMTKFDQLNDSLK